MPSHFLQAFAYGIVTRLVENEELIVQEGRFNTVVSHVAAELAAMRAGNSLVSTVSTALIRCDHVEDLFADDQTIKEHVNSMGSMDG